MKKSTATLLTIGGLAIGLTAGTAEFTATESGKKIIDEIEQGTVKDLGEKTRATTIKFNKRLINDFDETEGGSPNDSVTVTLNGQDYVITQKENKLYDELMQMVENDSNFTDEDEELIERYILSSFAAKDGKASGIIKFSSPNAEKARARSKVYAMVQAQQKIKTDALYGDGSKPKTREDFESFKDYMAYTAELRKKTSKQIDNQVKDASKINLDDKQDDDWGDDDFLNEENAALDKENATLDKQLRESIAKLQERINKGEKLDKEIAAAKAKLKALKNK